MGPSSGRWHCRRWPSCSWQEGWGQNRAKAGCHSDPTRELNTESRSKFLRQADTTRQGAREVDCPLRSFPEPGSLRRATPPPPCGLLCPYSFPLCSPFLHQPIRFPVNASSWRAIIHQRSCYRSVSVSYSFKITSHAEPALLERAAVIVRAVIRVAISTDSGSGQCNNASG